MPEGALANPPPLLSAEALNLWAEAEEQVGLVSACSCGCTRRIPPGRPVAQCKGARMQVPADTRGQRFLSCTKRFTLFTVRLEVP